MMKILVVDDEKKIANVLSDRLVLRGFDAAPVYDAESALSQLRQNTFDGVILDLRLPDIDGVEVLRKVVEDFPGTRVVIVSGHANEEEFKACLDIGAFACFHKPVNIDTIIKALEGARI
jgi:DNA-binding response OmpR family regulator